MDGAVNWTQDDYAEFRRRCEEIRESYGGSIPEERVQHFAAEIVNRLKG